MKSKNSLIYLTWDWLLNLSSSNLLKALCTSRAWKLLSWMWSRCPVSSSLWCSWCELTTTQSVSPIQIASSGKQLSSTWRTFARRFLTTECLERRKRHTKDTKHLTTAKSWLMTTRPRMLNSTIQALQSSLNGWQRQLHLESKTLFAEWPLLSVTRKLAKLR